MVAEENTPVGPEKPIDKVQVEDVKDVTRAAANATVLATVASWSPAERRAVEKKLLRKVSQLDVTLTNLNLTNKVLASRSTFVFFQPQFSCIFCKFCESTSWSSFLE